MLTTEPGLVRTFLKIAFAGFGVLIIVLIRVGLHGLVSAARLLMAFGSRAESRPFVIIEDSGASAVRDARKDFRLRD